MLPMQLPPPWYAALHTVWPRYRFLLYGSVSLLALLITWFIPPGHQWLLGQAQAFGLLSSSTDSVVAGAVSTSSPTADPITQLQKSVDTLSAASTAEVVARQQGQTQLQETVTQLQSLLTDIDRSNAELGTLVGISSTSQNQVSTKIPSTPTKQPVTNSAGGSTSHLQSPLPPSSTKSVLTGFVHINSASLSELESLPGIGPAYAQRIIAYRIEHGGFRDLSEVAKVKGIGSARLEKIRSHLAL